MEISVLFRDWKKALHTATKFDLINKVDAAGDARN